MERRFIDSSGKLFATIVKKLRAPQRQKLLKRSIRFFPGMHERLSRSLDAGMPFHLAGHEDYGYTGVNLKADDPRAYTHFIYVCRPWSAEQDRALDDRRKAEIIERQARALKRVEEIHGPFRGLFE